MGETEHQISAKSLENFRRHSAPSLKEGRERAMATLGEFFDRATFAEDYRGLKLGIWPSEEALASRRLEDVPQDQTFDSITARWSPDEKREQWGKVLSPLEDETQRMVLTCLYMHILRTDTDKYQATAEELEIPIDKVKAYEASALEIIREAANPHQKA